MKTLATLIILLFMATAAQARKIEVNNIEKAAVTDFHTNETLPKIDRTLAHLYRSKGFRVKKELAFMTKTVRTKFA